MCKKMPVYAKMKQEQKKRQTWSEDAELPPIAVHLLSMKKSAHKKCQLCTRAGTLMCAHCRVTFYCDKNHYQFDRELHRAICKKLKVVLSPPEFYADKETRERMKKQRKLHLQDLCNFTYWHGKVAMEAGNYNKAIPAASMSAKHAEEAYGDLQLVIPPLLVTAECYLHKNNMQMAQTMLVRVARIEDQLADIQPAIKASIRRNEGLMYLAKLKLEDASYNFSEEIYQNSKAFGTMHIRTSPGYCYLGEVFRRQGNYEAAATLFRTATSIWMTFIEPHIQIVIEETKKRAHGAIILDSQKRSAIDERDKFEGLKVLKKVTRCVKLLSRVHRQPLDLIHCGYALAAINFCAAQYHEADILITEALSRCRSFRLTEEPVFNQLEILDKYCQKKVRRPQKKKPSRRPQSLLGDDALEPETVH